MEGYKVTSTVRERIRSRVDRIQSRVLVCKKHLKHSIQWKGEILGIAEMKRHYTNYFKGIPHFKDYRIKMVTSDNPEEVHAILETVAKEFSF